MVNMVRTLKYMKLIVKKKNSDFCRRVKCLFKLFKSRLDKDKFVFLYQIERIFERLGGVTRPPKFFLVQYHNLHTIQFHARGINYLFKMSLFSSRG